MSMEIRLFQDPSRGHLSQNEMVQRLDTIAGLGWEHRQPGYARFTIQDPVTGATAHGDVGQPTDLEQDGVHPEKTYEGCHDLGVRIVIPLVAPTWIVDCCAWLMTLDIPGLLVLDVEDTRDPQGADGPARCIHRVSLPRPGGAAPVQCATLQESPRCRRQRQSVPLSASRRSTS